LSTVECCQVLQSTRHLGHAVVRNQLSLLSTDTALQSEQAAPKKVIWTPRLSGLNMWLSPVAARAGSDLLLAASATRKGQPAGSSGPPGTCSSNSDRHHGTNTPLACKYMFICVQTAAENAPAASVTTRKFSECIPTWTGPPFKPDHAAQVMAQYSALPCPQSSPSTQTESRLNRWQQAGSNSKQAGSTIHSQSTQAQTPELAAATSKQAAAPGAPLSPPHP
jgi:hypothetical protein